jgi:hypothetical protein
MVRGKAVGDRHRRLRKAALRDFDEFTEIREGWIPGTFAGLEETFDDYGFATAQGEREAVDKFFADKPESPIVLPTGQAMILKVPEPAP